MTTLFHYMEKAIAAGQGEFKILARKSLAGPIEFSIFPAALTLAEPAILAAFTAHSNGNISNVFWRETMSAAEHLLTPTQPAPPPPPQPTQPEEEASLGKSLNGEGSPTTSSTGSINPSETWLPNPNALPMLAGPDITAIDLASSSSGDEPLSTLDMKEAGATISNNPSLDSSEPVPPTDTSI